MMPTIVYLKIFYFTFNCVYMGVCWWGGGCTGVSADAKDVQRRAPDVLTLESGGCGPPDVGAGRESVFRKSSAHC